MIKLDLFLATGYNQIWTCLPTINNEKTGQKYRRQQFSDTGAESECQCMGFFFFLLNNNCFTEFCCFLSNLNMNQPQVYIYPLPLDPPSYLPPHPSPLGWYRALFVPWAIQQIPVGYLFYIWWCKFPYYSFLTSHPPLPSPHGHKSLLYVCSSIAAL